MKKQLLTLMVAACAASVMVSGTAEAKRMGGGGGSIGRQSSNVTQKAPPAMQGQQPAQAAKPAAPAQSPAPAATTPPPKPASPWKGMLGGALLGLGLGALLSHFGLGGAMASFISTLLMVGLIALVAMFIFRMFRRKNESMQPSYAGQAPYASGNTPDIGNRIEPVQYQNNTGYSTAAAGGTPEIGSRLNTPEIGSRLNDTAVVDAAPAATWGIPADFDVPAFVRNAKTYFIRLQAAWDKADAADIREFTTPEMYAEIKMQLQERGASPNHTDVVLLNADLLGIETLANDYLASVKFSGMIKEAENASAEPFEEVWNLSKPLNGQGGWLLAGIQQLS